MVYTGEMPGGKTEAGSTFELDTVSSKKMGLMVGGTAKKRDRRVSVGAMLSDTTLNRTVNSARSGTDLVRSRARGPRGGLVCRASLSSRWERDRSRQVHIHEMWVPAEGHIWYPSRLHCSQPLALGVRWSARGRTLQERVDGTKGASPQCAEPCFVD